MMSFKQSVAKTMYWFAILIWPHLIVSGFNIDMTNVKVISGPKDTYFGFSAGFVPSQDGGGTLGMFVGAPKAKFTEDGVISGVLFLCENVLDEDEGCTIKRRYDNDKKGMPDATDQEEFGSTLVMTNSQNYMVCSPNWKDTSAYQFTFLIGRCTLASMEDEVIESIQPYFQENDRPNYTETINGQGTYFYGLASYGFSADSDKKSVFVIGAPGVLMSQGSVMIRDIATNKVSNTTVNKKDVFSTAYGYLGYSVKIGRFCDGADVCFAASAPNMNRVGMVQFYRWEKGQSLRRTQMLPGKQAWSYFGYAMCTVDANSDGYDELLVGAPQFTDLEATPHVFDHGQVFIYSRSSTKMDLEQVGILEGTKQKFARFGSAIQNIGDINLDKHNDVAVGAPGEDEGDGCIYIYLGGPSGLTTLHSQRITAKQISKGLSVPVIGFGFAFSDHATTIQKYPIFAATSIASDIIAVFKTRPVVDVIASLIAEPNPVEIEQNCKLAEVPGGCFKINLCMKYTLRGGGNTALTFKVGFDTDVQVRSHLKRIFIRLTNGSFVESIPEYEKQLSVSVTDDCTMFLAVLKENLVNQDRFTPVEIIAKYTLIEDTTVSGYPILDTVKPNDVSLKVTFVNNCGTDNKCNVDLSVVGTLKYNKQSGEYRSIVANNTKELQVAVAVKNSQEPSYWTLIKIEIDSNVPYNGFQSGAAMFCQLASESSNTVSNGQDRTTVVCNYYKPLEKNATVELHIMFDTEQIELNKKTLKITAEATPGNANSNEISAENNNVVIETDVEIIADVSIVGSSTPPEVDVDEVKKISLKDAVEPTYKFRPTGKDVKPFNVTHKYVITNNGPSFLPRTNIAIRVPMFLLDRTELITEADVKIGTADGRVAQCYGNVSFDYLQQTTSSTPSLTSESYTTTSSDMNRQSSSGTQATTTSGFSPVNARKKRAADDKEKDKETVYTLDCESSPEICQVFICEIWTIEPSGSYAQINVSLVVDKANIPLPENYNAFYYTIQAEVIEPSHMLFKKWVKKPIDKTVTKFHLAQAGGKINIWIIIGSVIAGLVLITIIVLIFWKLGFFKRQKHHEVEQWRRESQKRPKKGHSNAPKNDEGESTPAEDVDS